MCTVWLLKIILINKLIIDAILCTLKCTMRVGIKEAREKIGDLLDRAKMGEEVILTRRGVPEGKIIAFDKMDCGNKGLPDLSDLYESFNATGKPISEIVTQEREQRS